MAEFKNAEVAKKYDMVPAKDRRVTIPGVYSGMLSEVTTEGADKMFNDGDNQLTEKKPQSKSASPDGTSK